MKEIELNIQPEAGILNVFSRLNYKPWYAIAEFVDNSTQSYYNHVKKLEAEKEFKRLEITITFDEKQNTLKITDNAYGMNLEEFKLAVLLDAKHAAQQGRNEFGMGLKTAASWFGNVWLVSSTQLGSKLAYSTVVDINHLKKNHVNTVTIKESEIDEGSHGTVVFIKEITKPLTGSRTIGKIRELLGSMYRRDIASGKVQIIFNGEIISYNPNPVLTFKEKEWKKDLDFNIEFNNRTHRITGFVAIMNPGSFPKAGFALFRNNRVVIGGSDTNYKPQEIFGQAQSQISLKLFGELNVNSFPVNQAKDGFVWDNGLEDEFIKVLKENVQEYRDIAELSSKAREEQEQFSKQKSDNVLEATTQALGKLQDTTKKEDVQALDQKHEESETDLGQYKKDFLGAQEEVVSVGAPRPYKVKLNRYEELDLNIIWKIGSQEYWIEVEEKDGITEVVINIDHPFFKPYSKEEHFKLVLEKFVAAFIIAEKQAAITSNKDGYVLPSTIRNKINEILAIFSEE